MSHRTIFLVALTFLFVAGGLWYWWSHRNPEVGTCEINFVYRICPGQETLAARVFANAKSTSPLEYMMTSSFQETESACGAVGKRQDVPYPIVSEVRSQVQFKQKSIFEGSIQQAACPDKPIMKYDSQNPPPQYRK